MCGLIRTEKSQGKSSVTLARPAAMWMASWPTYDPNLFVPSISTEKFKQLQDDPDLPLLARAFRSAYPPGSTFKVAVGIAALETGAVHADDLYQCVPGIQIGNLTFHNWKKGDRGALNFVQALPE